MLQHFSTRLLPLALAAAALAACSSTGDQPAAPRLAPRAAPNHDGAPAVPDIVISQIYGGGGNSGATLKNDFVELFNPGGSAVSVEGWSVQYASAAGTGWATTPLTGSIPSGGYYLVGEAAGSGGTVNLPALDATGSIAMSATNAKVILSRTTTALSGTCPTGSSVVDFVTYGSVTTNCVPALATAPTLTNTTADLRKMTGCTYTGDASADFATGAPSPRNHETAAAPCPGTGIAGPLDHVALSGASTVVVGNTIQLAAVPQDASNRTVPTATITWGSSDPSIASVDATGKVTGVAADPTPVTITATATDGPIVKMASQPVTVITPSINWIDLSSSATSFPPGYQTQLFATARVASGGTIVTATFTFEALDPGIATIATVQNTGIITGVAASATRPRFRVTAVPVGGGTPYVFTSSSVVTIETAAPAPPSIYAINDDFGDPSAATGSKPNDLLIVRPQYTLSYNESRGTPNWVSYELDSRQMVVGGDRCNCFTADPLLPLDKQILTSDYTNGGFDRGHMTRSADRTAGNVDNANTFYLTNVVPQMADLNQGVWAQFENMLADSAQHGRAVYIVTGPLYSRSHGLTFIKDEGKIAIPDSTWKVALIGPIVGGVPFTHGGIHSLTDLTGITVLAVNMPNVAGVRSDPPSKYFTTIGKIEDATGLNFLSVLDEAIQCRVEVRNCLPVSHVVSASGASTTQSGAVFTLNIGATDADGADGPWKLNVDWGDGTAQYNTTFYALPTDARPFARAHAWVGAPGTQYTATVSITDKRGGVATSTFVVTIVP